MAEQTGISWADHTWNPWRGCHKVSPGCDFCYAEKLSERNPSNLGEWGKDANRVIGAEPYWNLPMTWDRKAAADGVRRRVFTLSLGDFFEDRDDLLAPRLRALDVIRLTPHLDWMVLTKRPKSILPLLRAARDGRAPKDGADDFLHEPDAALCDWLTRWLNGDPPANVWLGTSVEDQLRAEQRVPALLRVPAVVHFLSMEPLLGAVDLSSVHKDAMDEAHGVSVLESGVSWIIVGGESGAHARPMHPDWARVIRDQAALWHVPLHFKQWGEWLPVAMPSLTFNGLRCVMTRNAEVTLATPADVIGASGDTWGFEKVGPRAAGHRLDQHEHQAFPVSQHPR